MNLCLLCAVLCFSGLPCTRTAAWEVNQRHGGMKVCRVVETIGCDGLHHGRIGNGWATQDAYAAPERGQGA